jgi:hypothetical protein
MMNSSHQLGALYSQPKAKMKRFLALLSVLLSLLPSHCFFLDCRSLSQRAYTLQSDAIPCNTKDVTLGNSPASRRDILGTTILTSIFAFSSPALAANREPLDDLLYRIIRVREATAQETRLIKSGKFKDSQRANIKLAVRFMVENYRLNDAFVAASTYLDGTNRRLEASQIGQSATQNLYTILEYFDAADVQNLKVCIGRNLCLS